MPRRSSSSSDMLSTGSTVFWIFRWSFLIALVSLALHLVAVYLKVNVVTLRYLTFNSLFLSSDPRLYEIFACVFWVAAIFAILSGLVIVWRSFEQADELYLW